MQIIEKNGNKREYEGDILPILRHTAAHMMAQAVKRLYPTAQLAIGPSIKDGFYYDFETPEPLTTEHLRTIEKEMKKIAGKAYPLEYMTRSRNEALKWADENNEPYKRELILDLPENETISFFRQGNFEDLCAGPHLSNTRFVKAFKLTSLAGAYWKGSENNKMLIRIYGTAFADKASLKEYLNRIEEAKKRDHRKLGQQLELFTFMEEGTGFPFFLPKGMLLKNTLIQYWRALHEREYYQEISTPVMLNQKLWETSGHWDHYKENMYTSVIDDQVHAVKPMNCPGSMLVYKMKKHSYRELPLRYGELGLIHRHEKSGALHGLMRVRSFTQDDAHIFMSPDQIIPEIKNVIQMIDEVYAVFGFKYHVELSTRPDDSIGSDADWELASNGLKQALEETGLAYIVNEGDGAFYGPKIDFHLEDSLGRVWQCGSIQLDFQLPLRFETEYIGSDGSAHRPIMIHRVIFGSIERFIGILTEHFAGCFPLWLAPVQIKILPLSDKYTDYARQLEAQLKNHRIRVESDTRDEPIGNKIRHARTERVPYLVIIGEKELALGQITVRSRDSGEQISISAEDFTSMIRQEIEEKL